MERRVALALPSAPPERFEVVVPFGESAVVLELRRHSLRAPGAFVRVVGAAGETRDEEPAPATTYRGGVRGAPGSTVLAALVPAGLSATIELAAGERYRIEPERAQRAATGLHVLRPSPPPESFECGSEALPDAGISGARAPFSGGVPGPECLLRATIAFEADHPFFVANGSVPATVAAIDAMMNEVDFVFARDLQTTHAITAYVVRTAPYYAPLDGWNLLNLFAAEWQTNQTDVPRDMAHLVVGAYRPELLYSGVAFLGSVCDPAFHYGWSVDSSHTITHELGHNWGAVHCHDVTPCNVMCDGCLWFGPETRAVIQAIRATMTCLEAAEPYPTPVAPYVAPERVVLSKDELVARAPLAFDVLANDADGNCSPLHVASFAATSLAGAPIRRSAGPGPRSSGELEYDSSDPVVGSDSFQYVVSDGRDLGFGTVTVEALPLEVRAYFPLDEASGTSAADASGHGHEGALHGDPSRIPGRFGGALAFDGVDDSVVLPPLDLHSNHVTITTWLYREGRQQAWAGLVYTRAGNSVAGLHFGPGAGARLRYTWNGDPATYDWAAPELLVPTGTWFFAALVIRPHDATIYLHDGTALVSATNHVSHAPEQFDGETHLGQDPYPGRRFHGRMDDVRIFPYALSAAEIAALAAGGGRADAPFPRDGGKLAGEGDALSWLAAPGASDHALYLGTSFGAVRDATPTSPEFRGFFDAAGFVPGLLAPGQRYYWRVDAVPFVAPGHVWQFERRTVHRWALDEKEGPVASDSGAKRDGLYYGNPLLYQPGATPALGHAVQLDGDDLVLVHPLAVEGDPFYTERATITLWLRPEGDVGSNPFLAGANGLGAGLWNLGGELFHGWGGGSLVPSGLVLPDGEWSFVALVFEPGRDRLHLGSAGALTHVVSQPSQSRSALSFDTCWIGSGFRGLLDDVRFHDDALTPAQIEALYAESR